MRVLIVEDDRDLALAISEYLELHHLECDFAYTGESGIELAITHRFDCIILDNMLPITQGVEVCKALRSKGVATPILMLTACDTTQEQLAGFNAGLDDFVAKPCPMPILLARLQALYRRHLPERDRIDVADLVIYPKENRAMRANKVLKIPPTSWKMLLILARHSPEVVTKQTLAESIWPDEDVDEGTLNVHLHQLRKIVDRPFDSALIQTHVGMGLSLQGTENDRTP